MRVKFARGKQREFIRKVMEKAMSPSLRKLEQYGISVNYQTLKSYYSENRTLPLTLFEDFCRLSGIDKNKLKIKLIDENWGKVKGGKR